MSSKVKTSIIVVGWVILLAAAAFVGLSLLNPNLAGKASLPADASGKKTGLTVDLIMATEIPTTIADAEGRLQTLQNNSLMVQPDSQGAPAALVEVVVTAQTHLYHDTTGDQFPGAGVTGRTVQEVVVPYSLAQIVVGDRIIAWGDRRGDRVVADVIVVRHHPPAP